MRRTSILILFFIFVVTYNTPSVLSHEVKGPKGAAVLTIIGNIHHTNRAGSDSFHDAFFKHHDRNFNEAYVFDRAMLTKLEQVEITAQAEGWGKPIKLRGPTLEKVLSKAGALGQKYSFMALDGYAASINLKELDSHKWVLALEADGKPLGLGGRGPLWLAYDTGKTAASSEQEGKWVWSVFLIEVE